MQRQHTAVAGSDVFGSQTESEANRGTREMGSSTESGAQIKKHHFNTIWIGVLENSQGRQP